MIFGKKCALLPVLAVALLSFAQTEASLGYRVEADVNVSAGEYAPMWMTANRYGLASERPNSGWLRAGVTYDQPLKRKHSKKCTFYTLRFGCSFAAVNTIKPQLL